MKTAAFCGTFDPVTLGHVDLIKRASKMFDKLVVFVSPNSLKTNTFSNEQKLAWLNEITKDMSNVECYIQDGLVVEACHKVGATVLVRGIRNTVDFEYEKNMAGMNALIDPAIDTICLFTREDLALCSSTNVREFIKYGLDISSFVPECVLKTIKERKSK